jgi:hypothetical protein
MVLRLKPDGSIWHGFLCLSRVLPDGSRKILVDDQIRDQYLETGTMSNPWAEHERLAFEFDQRGTPHAPETA